MSHYTAKKVQPTNQRHWPDYRELCRQHERGEIDLGGEPLAPAGRARYRQLIKAIAAQAERQYMTLRAALHKASKQHWDARRAGGRHGSGQ